MEDIQHTTQIIRQAQEERSASRPVTAVTFIVRQVSRTAHSMLPPFLQSYLSTCVCCCKHVHAKTSKPTFYSLTNLTNLHVKWEKNNTFK